MRSSISRGVFTSPRGTQLYALRKSSVYNSQLFSQLICYSLLLKHQLCECYRIWNDKTNQRFLPCWTRLNAMFTMKPTVSWKSTTCSKRKLWLNRQPARYQVWRQLPRFRNTLTPVGMDESPPVTRTARGNNTRAILVYKNRANTDRYTAVSYSREVGRTMS